MGLVAAICGSVLYHVLNRFIDPRASTEGSLLATYVTANALVGIVAFGRLGAGPTLALLSGVNWQSYALGAAVVAIEFGFLLAYRSGWPVSSTALVVAASVSSILAIVGTLVLGEAVTFRSCVGVGLAILGVGLIAIK